MHWSLGKHPHFAAPLPPCNLPLRRCPVGEGSASRRILIMPRMAHGDILMATPLLAALRAAYPDAYITCVAERPVRETIEANPFVDALLIWDGMYWKRMARRGLYPLWLTRVLALWRQLRDRRYDVFISLDAEYWPLLVKGARAPASIGVFDTFREHDLTPRTSARARLYTTAYTHADLPVHRTDQYLLPLRALHLPEPADKRMTLGYTGEDCASMDAFLAKHRLSPADRFVVLAPTTTWPSRCWPADRYARIGDLLDRQEGCRIVLIGGVLDRPVMEAIAAGMQTRPIIAAGETTFRQLGVLLDRAALLITGDTGPMHAAGAVGAPFLALFGPTPVAGRAPRGGRGLPLVHPLPCSPCEQKRCPLTGEDHMLCMRLLTVEHVFEAARHLLNGGSGVEGEAEPIACRDRGAQRSAVEN